jgi:Peptidase family S41
MDRRHFLSNVGAGAVGSMALLSLAYAAKPPAIGDVSLVREILTQLHPGLYRYTSPKSIDAGLAQLERGWAGQNLQQRFLSLARLLTTIKCGHSYPNFFNQKAAIQKELFDPETPFRLPFAFRWIGDQMVVTANQSQDVQLPVGNIVKAINGVPVRDILKRLLPYVRADGHNDDKRRALLSASGADEIETFDVFYGLLYGAPKSGFFNIHYRIPNTERDVRADMKPLNWAERKAFIRQKDSGEGDQPIWEWTMRPDSIAVLKMDGWALYNSKWKWRDWLDDRLDSLHGAKGLIVDIRENEGGEDCGDAILARLAGSDIVKPAVRRLVRYDHVLEKLNPYLDTWDDSFRNWGKQVRRYDDRFFEQIGEMADPVIKAKGPKVAVPMVVLTSAQNSSATFQFASLCKTSGLGKLIGETTGGNQRGINGGAFFFARLPESGLEFDVPLIGIFPEGRTPPDAGLSPDIAVATTVGDIAAGRDPQLAAAIAHLSS